MGINDIARFISTFLSIVLTLVILYVIISTIRSNNSQQEMFGGENKEAYTYEEDPLIQRFIEKKNKKTKKKKNRKYQYEKYDVPMTFKNVEENDLDDSKIGYKDLIRKVEDDGFIREYKDAITRSLEYKVPLYKEKLDSINEELKVAKEKQEKQGIQGKLMVDSATSRLLRMSTMLNVALNEISHRMREITCKQIKKNLRDAIYDEDKGMASLVGREDIKDFLCTQLYSFCKNPNIFIKNFQNIRIYGNSGVGKTKLGETIGFVYSKSGILLSNKFKIVTNSDFISSYVGETAVMTRELLFESLEGVLFIDEAYEMAPPAGMLGIGVTSNHKGEAITEMINFTDKNVGLGVIIVAGYEKDMEERFMTSNQGMERRFPYLFKLPNYSSKQLTDILMKFLEDSVDNDMDIVFTDSDASVLYTILSSLVDKYPNIFPRQAGDMKNLSTNICKQIYASEGIHWINGNPRNNSILLTKGINSYLSSRGLTISYQ
jgi:hypothetical protein